METHPLIGKFPHSSLVNFDQIEQERFMVDHGTVVAIPTSNKSNTSQDNSLPLTALVLGLASAVCFVLMVVYIVLKVHCFKKKQTPKLPKSKISSEVLGKEAVANPSSFTNTGFVMSVSDLQPSVQAISSSARTIPITVSRTHSIDFNNTTNEPVLVESTSKARLTGARFLPGH